jgi:hypothetical protein
MGKYEKTPVHKCARCLDFRILIPNVLREKGFDITQNDLRE